MRPPLPFAVPTLLVSCLGAIPCHAALPPGTRAVMIRFFESGKGVPPQDRRIYSANFDVHTTRFVNIELHLVYPRTDVAVEFPLDCVYGSRRGAIGQAHLDARIEAGSTNAYYATGSGYVDPGHWSQGVYLVQCRSGAVKFDAMDFNIVATAAETRPFQSAGGRVVRVRTFAGGPRFVPENERTYTSTFNALALTWVNVAIDVTYGGITDRDGTGVRLSCVFRNSRGVIGESGVRDVLLPNHTRAEFDTWTGFPQPGMWPPGRYTVECRESGTRLFETQFDVRPPGS